MSSTAGGSPAAGDSPPDVELRLSPKAVGVGGKNESASPAHVKPVSVDGKQFLPVHEGQAVILVPHEENGKDGGGGGGGGISTDGKNGQSSSTSTAKGTGVGGQPKQSVFYNPIQQFNRDLSVLAARVFAEELTAHRACKRARKLAAGEARGPGGGKMAKQAKDSKPVVGGGTAAASVDQSATSKEPAANVDQNGISKEPAVKSGDRTETANKDVVTGDKADGAEASTSTKRKRDGPPSSAEQELETKKVKVDDEVPPSADKPHKSENIDDQHVTDTATAGHARDTKSHKTAAKDEKNMPIPFRVLDALSATGLRALRYAKEVPQVTSVTANDLSGEAVKFIKRNIEYNKAADKVFATLGSASGHMYHVGNDAASKLPDGTIGKYDIIDLDPYGTAASFIDSSVQALTDGGMLSITCTDSATFASVGYLEKTFALYGGLPWRGSSSHEAGLRLIIQSIATCAARYGLAIEPMLSLSIDYYVRMFIRVRRSPNEVKLLPGKTMTVYNCDHGCSAWKKQFLVKTNPKQNRKGETIYQFQLAQAPTASTNCQHCGFKMHIAGPMWGGPLHNPFFVQRMLEELPKLDEGVYKTIPRMEGMLNTALQETSLLNLGREAGKGSGPEASAETNGNSNSKNGTASAADFPPAFQPIRRLDPVMRDDHPFFFQTGDVSRVLHCSVPSDAQLRGALKHLGYRVARSHCKPGSIKTDAPWSVVWDVMRAWVRQKAPIKQDALREGTAGYRIWKNEHRQQDVKEVEDSLRKLLGGSEGKVKAAMSVIEEMRKSDGKPSKQLPLGEAAAGATSSDESGKGKGGTAVSSSGEEREIVFDEELGRDPDKKKMLRYQINPRENWGPQARAR